MLEKFLALLERIAIALEYSAARGDDPYEGAQPMGLGTPVIPDATAPARRGRKPKVTPESTQPATTALTAATAPAAQAAPAVSSTPADPNILQKATGAIIDLANLYSRDQALAILAKYKVNRCSDLKPEEWQPVLTEATNAISAAEAAKQAATANASLV